MAVPVLRHRNGILYLDNTPLQTESIQESYLSEPAALGEQAIFVQSYEGFADNQILCIEDFGSESAEIVTVNGSPTANTGIVLDAVLARSHPVGSKVYVLNYNQVELSRAATAAGAKVTLTTTLGSGLVAIVPDRKVQRYAENEYTSGFYFARYYNSQTTTFSGYTDALEYGGWDSNTVGYIIERALADLDETLSKKVKRDDLYAWITTCLQEIEGKQVRWPDHFAFNQVVGQATRGTNIFTMPTDAYDQESNKSLLAVRLGKGRALQYLDPIEFDAQQEDVCVTQVRTQAVATDTTLAIDNSYDFADSGTVHVYVSGTRYDITYTGVTRSATTGILTGIPASGTGSITVTIPVDTYVWQNEEEGEPMVYTVRNGNLEFYPLADSTEDNKNVYADYAKVATAVDTDGDTIDYQRFDTVQRYLTWRVWCKARNGGVLDQQSGFYASYREALNDAIRTAPRAIHYKTRPAINRMMKTQSWKKQVLPE